MSDFSPETRNSAIWSGDSRKVATRNKGIIRGNDRPDRRDGFAYFTTKGIGQAVKVRHKILQELRLWTF